MDKMNTLLIHFKPMMINCRERIFKSLNENGFSINQLNTKEKLCPATLLKDINKIIKNNIIYHVSFSIDVDKMTIELCDKNSIQLFCVSLTFGFDIHMCDKVKMIHMLQYAGDVIVDLIVNQNQK